MTRKKHTEIVALTADRSTWLEKLDWTWLRLRWGCEDVQDISIYYSRNNTYTTAIYTESIRAGRQFHVLPITDGHTKPVRGYHWWECSQGQWHLLLTWLSLATDHTETKIKHTVGGAIAADGLSGTAVDTTPEGNAAETDWARQVCKRDIKQASKVSNGITLST
jgi:hypothetical protein